MSPSPRALTGGNYQGGPWELPSKRRHDSTADPRHNVLYKKMKEVAGAYDNLQFHPQYSDVTQPALREIVALLEYDVLRHSTNSLHYQKDMVAMKKVIDASTETGEVNDKVEKVLGFQATA